MPLNISSLSPREQVSAIYIAYYDRAPDPAGIDFWVNVLTSNQLTLNGIAQAFSTAAETKLKYPFFNNPDPVGYSSFVDAIYQNLFGREPDAPGKAFWTGALSTEAVKPGEFILEVLKGAQDSTNTLDLSTIQNKIDVAEDWAADAAVKSIGTAQNPFAEEIDGEFFVRDAAVFGSATSILDGVTGDPASVTTAKAETDAFFTDQFLTITPSADAFDEGTAASFTFNTSAEEGSVIAFTIAGTVDEADISGGRLVGLTTVGADGTATISIDLVADKATEGSETLTLLAGIGGETNLQATVDTIVNDTSVADVVTVPTPTQEIAPFIANATEYGIGNADSAAPSAGVHTLLDSDADNASDTTNGKESHWEGEGKFNTPTSLTFGFVDAGGQMLPGAEVRTVDVSYLDTEKLFIRSVFDIFTNVANVTFTEVADAQGLTSADIRLGKGSAEALGVQPDTLGFAFQPDNTESGSGTILLPKESTTDEALNYIGDFFLVTDAITVPDWTAAPYDDVKNTIAHELGHAMGLDHPFRSESGAEGGFRPIDDTSAPLENYTGQQTGGGHQSNQTDNMIETIMTYYSPSDTGAISINGNDIEGAKVTNWKPGVMDIAALQHLYGTNVEYNKDGTVYEFGSNDIVYDTIWDAGGVDTLRVSGTGVNNINLNDGSYSKVGVMASRIYDVTNTILGLQQDAVITGVTAKVGSTSIGLWSNIIESGSGVQFAVDLPTLKGLEGSIELTFDYAQNDAPSSTSFAIGDASNFFRAGETEFNFGIAHGVIIENIVTGDGADVVIGNEAGNNIAAGGGNNTLTGDGGADVFLFTSDTLVSSATLITDFVSGADKLQFNGNITFSSNAADGDNWVLAWDNGNHTVTLAGVDSFDLATDAILQPSAVARLATPEAGDYWIA